MWRFGSVDFSGERWKQWLIHSQVWRIVLFSPFSLTWHLSPFSHYLAQGGGHCRCFTCTLRWCSWMSPLLIVGRWSSRSCGPGSFTSAKGQSSINCLELLAVRLALNCLNRCLRGKHMRPLENRDSIPRWFSWLRDLSLAVVLLPDRGNTRHRCTGTQLAVGPFANTVGQISIWYSADFSSFPTYKEWRDQ